MDRPAKKMNPSNMVTASFSSHERAKDILETAEKLKTDPDKEKRLKIPNCLTCFYIYTMRAGGAAITTQPCMSCKVPQRFGNTCTDVLCTECAIKHKLCKHCGGDIEMRYRRRKWPQPDKE